MPIDQNSTTSSQDAAIRFEEGDSKDTMADKINKALQLVADDTQRVTSRQDRLREQSVLVPASSYRVICPIDGVATVSAISDTPTTGSNAGNYNALSLYRNGIAANTVSNQTRYKELSRYGTGVSLGQVVVNQGDVLAINLATVGVPTIINLSNLLIRVTITPQLVPTVVNR